MGSPSWVKGLQSRLFLYSGRWADFARQICLCLRVDALSVFLLGARLEGCSACLYIASRSGHLIFRSVSLA